MKLLCMHNLRAWSHIVGSVALILFLGACGVGKRAYTSGVSVEADKSALLARIETNRVAWSAVRGSWQGDISLGSKSFSSRINVSAVRTRGMYLSVVPFPLIEAARAWFMPEGITIVDVLNKRYVETSYAELSRHLGMTIDYAQVEALLLGQIFVPGRGTTARDIETLNYTSTPQGHRLDGIAGGYAYTFGLDHEGLLRSIEVRAGRIAKQPLFVASYAGALSLGATALPESTTMTFLSDQGEQRGQLSLVWSRLIESDTALEITPRIRQGYQRVELDAVLHLLQQL